MKPSDIQIGTTYRIRQWQDMVREYGVDGDGDIPVDDWTVFAPGMSLLCGSPYTPTDWQDKDEETLTPLVGGKWVICAAMLESLTAPTPTLRIGRFTLSRHDAESLWIATEDGEGGQFRDEVVEEALREMYKRYF